MIKIEKLERPEGYIHVSSTENKPIKNGLGAIHSEYIVLDIDREQYIEIDNNTQKD